MIESSTIEGTRESFRGSVPVAEAMHRVPWESNGRREAMNGWRHAVAAVGKRCELCWNWFLPKRTDALVCSDKCRVRKHRGEKPPPEPSLFSTLNGDDKDT